MRPLALKRVYDPPAETDGTRILVDRLWPRGVSKESVDLWLKDIAPSDVLRRRFHGHPERWDAFRAATPPNSTANRPKPRRDSCWKGGGLVRSCCSTQRATRSRTKPWR
jgi:hypothetical protein